MSKVGLYGNIISSADLVHIFLNLRWSSVVQFWQELANYSF